MSHLPIDLALTLASAGVDISLDEVWLERDVSDVDRYDRLLRSVWVEKTNGDVYQLNAVLVRDGFAAAVAYNPDTKYVL